MYTIRNIPIDGAKEIDKENKRYSSILYLPISQKFIFLFCFLLGDHRIQ